tara:strand:- start:387 stop:650 length:264 start_codon:yes stop_codon:yes gene_type:complete
MHFPTISEKNQNARVEAAITEQLSSSIMIKQRRVIDRIIVRDDVFNFRNTSEDYRRFLALKVINVMVSHSKIDRDRRDSGAFIRKAL